jgi:hypothetical protein
MSGAILHDVDDCSTCGGYFSHFHKAYRQKSPTMLDALNERAALTVPVDEHEKLFAKFEDRTEDGRDMLDEIKRLKAESDDQQRQIRELTAKHEEMLRDQVNPSASFKRKKTVAEQVAEPVQRTMRPLPVRTVQPSTARQVVAPPPNETPVPPVPSTSTWSMAQGYEDLQDDDEELTNPEYWKEVEIAQTSPTANLLAALSRDSNPRNRSQQGRGREITITLNPRNEAELKLVMDHLDVHHDERLYTAARKFISGLHGVTSALRNDHQKAMLSTWRQPTWVKHKTYDKTTGKLVLSDKTVSEAKIEGPPSKLQTQQRRIADKLGIDKWDTRLGNLGSPQHGDHPLVWAHFLRHFVGPNSTPRGLTSGKNGWVSQRTIRQFLRLRPLFIESGPNAEIVSTMRLTVFKTLAIPGRYRSLVENYKIPIAGTPSWSTIPIPESHDEVGTIRSLAATGFSLDEADDAYWYASSYLTDIAHDPQATPGAQGFAQAALITGSKIPPVDPWPEVLPFTYSEHHRRWIPVISPAGDTGLSRDASAQMSGGYQGPSSGDRSGGTIPKPESVVPPTEDATMSSVDIAAREPLPETPPGSVSGELDEDMSEPAADGIQKMDTVDQS